jgi:hypothetical protein
MSTFARSTRSRLRAAIVPLALVTVACQRGQLAASTAGIGGGPSGGTTGQGGATSASTAGTGAGGATSTSSTGSTGGGCDTGPFAAGHWPPGCYRPYGDASPFNTPVPPAPKLMSNSAAIVSRILGDLASEKQPSNLGAPYDGTGGWPTYWANATDPVYTIACNEFGGGCSISGASIHAPAGAVIQGGTAALSMSGWDRHLTIVDQTSGWEYDLWHVSTSPLPPGGGTLQIGWGGHTKIGGGDGIEIGDGTGTASGFGNLAGRIRVEELMAGAIGHALTIAINCDDGTNVPPALAHDRMCADTTNAPPMGARFWLDMTAAAIDALPAPAWKKTILHAAASYGMYFNDTGSAFYFDFQLESGNQYTSLGASQDPWLKFAEDNGWPFYAPDNTLVGTFHNDDDGMNWDAQVWTNLKVLDPCVAQGTCP